MICELKATEVYPGVWLQHCTNPSCTHKDQLTLTPTLHRECTSQQPQEPPKPVSPPEPSLITKAAHFTAAAIVHALHGSPQCTQEQIDARLEICRHCPGDEKFPQGYWKASKDDPSVGYCLNCGCNAGAEQKYLNILAWADKECPIKAWPKITPLQSSPPSEQPSHLS